MKRIKLNRRDFTKLTMAAFGGMVAGTTIGCGSREQPGGTGGGGKATTSSTDPGSALNDGVRGGEPADPDKSESGETTGAAGDDVLAAWSGKHVCRGLNACKEKGAGGKNACAGQGDCATAKEHDCHYDNDCKYQGGCGTDPGPGKNSCAKKGECGVPLSDSAWERARAAFEKDMQAAGKEFGKEPPPG